MSCGFCDELKGIIEEINLLLPAEKRIQVIDATWDWGFKINLNPILKRLDIDATPSLYLDGDLYQGFVSRLDFKSFLMGYLKEIGDLKRRYFEMDEYAFM